MRTLVALLLLANLAFFTWTRGWLDDVVGVRAIGDREPERLLRQVNPDSVRILPAASGAAAASNASASSSCLEAGPFSDAELGAAQAAAQAALAGSAWDMLKTDVPAIWIVYMGRFADREAMARKEEEVKRRRLAYEEVRDHPALEPGLALGRFADRAAATRALEEITQQGVRTARVVELTAASSSHRVRIERADAALAMRLRSAAEGVLGKAFGACGAKAPGV